MPIIKNLPALSAYLSSLRYLPLFVPCYAVPGTNVCCGCYLHTPSVFVYARAMRCPVLTCAMVLPGRHGCADHHGE
eukprot:3386823-Rhodomonas_salina.1